MLAALGLAACSGGDDSVGPTGSAGARSSGDAAGQAAGGASAAGDMNDVVDANDVGASGNAATSVSDASHSTADGRTDAETLVTGVAQFQNASLPTDVAGKPINAHGPGFVQIGPTWYWVGEEMSDSSGISQRVNLYASTDLTHWEFKHTLITSTTAPGLGVTGRIIERPKLVYNDATHQFVMWVHWDSADYQEAAAGVFTSDSIDGDYRYVRSFRPNANMSRDCTLFKDDDGTAYFISAANNNADLVVYQLTADYLDIQRQVVVLWPGGTREAPAMFKANGRYFLINSGATSWNPNQAKYGWATSVMGPWMALQNLGDGTAYGSQVSYVIPVHGTQSTTYVYFADRWQYPDLVSSKYIWLPLTLNGTELQLTYRDQWQLDLATGVVAP